MKKILFAFFAICILSSSFGQNRKKDQEVDIIDHEVQLGESIRLISKKYLVDPAEIYKLNKFAVEGISQGMVLKIPVPRKEGAAAKVLVASSGTKETSANESSEVVQNETVVDDKATKNGPEKSEIVNANPTPNNDIKKIVITERKTEVNHKVTAKETLYSLARDFNVSVDDIKANNAETLKNGLKIGQIIKIPTEKSIDIKQSTSVTEETVKTEKQKPAVTQTKAAETVAGNAIKHKVEPKETLYSLSKKYNVSVDDIKLQNEDILKNGLQIGQILTIKTNN
ncbi:LysM peptidoglycan-binding domain-containing protein [Flavobacterium sp.]|uniref:LysM peptidoglycan-binding domain-containing protein n=1 Tax=Flavobacterium sp. TaxID=239 RepID=UPI00286B508E|nr:LysM peptidoglycan-binding domain-containing protein [Flavobacterium sp.]